MVVLSIKKGVASRTTWQRLKELPWRLFVCSFLLFFVVMDGLDCENICEELKTLSVVVVVVVFVVKAAKFSARFFVGWGGEK